MVATEKCARLSELFRSLFVSATIVAVLSFLVFGPLLFGAVPFICHPSAAIGMFVGIVLGVCASVETLKEIWSELS